MSARSANRHAKQFMFQGKNFAVSIVLCTIFERTGAKWSQQQWSILLKNTNNSETLYGTTIEEDPFCQQLESKISQHFYIKTDFVKSAKVDLLLQMTCSWSRRRCCVMPFVLCFHINFPSCLASFIVKWQSDLLAANSKRRRRRLSIKLLGAATRIRIRLCDRGPWEVQAM